MTFKSKLTTAIATGAVLVNALAPMAFADTITVTGNGDHSANQVSSTSNTTTIVNQSNDANITNNVSSSASTGGNSSTGNTGGSTTISTGNANTTTNVTNAANLNQASLNCASCNNGSTNVTVGGATGNGQDSNNTVNVTNKNGVFVNQTNDANFVNNVHASAKTGGNDTTSNTGGPVTVTTGNATSNVTVNNAANANSATVGGNNPGHAGGVSATITGNGEGSDNNIGLSEYSAVVLNQNNDANIRNFIGASAKTGGNSADGNTGGTVTVHTGDATTNTTVDNAANFNAADLNCNCVVDGLDAKIGGNGQDSGNTIYADSTNSLNPTQANDQGFANFVFGKSKTGWNSANGNTGAVYGDPSVTTGNGTSNNNVNNVGNVNTIGNVGGYSFGTTFDFSGLWLFLNGFMG